MQRGGGRFCHRCLMAVGYGKHCERGQCLQRKRRDGVVGNGEKIVELSHGVEDLFIGGDFEKIGEEAENRGGRVKN